MCAKSDMYAHILIAASIVGSLAGILTGLIAPRLGNPPQGTVLIRLEGVVIRTEPGAIVLAQEVPWAGGEAVPVLLYADTDLDSTRSVTKKNIDNTSPATTLKTLRVPARFEDIAAGNRIVAWVTEEPPLTLYRILISE